MAMLLAFCLVACHKDEQAVEGVAHDVAKAEHQAQVTATERDQERAELDQIPLPTKSLYIDIHDPSEWENPFLAVGAGTLSLRIILPDENPSSVGLGTLLRPAAARAGSWSCGSPIWTGPCLYSRRRVAIWPRHRRGRVVVCLAR